MTTADTAQLVAVAPVALGQGSVLNSAAASCERSNSRSISAAMAAAVAVLHRRGSQQQPAAAAAAQCTQLYHLRASRWQAAQVDAWAAAMVDGAALLVVVSLVLLGGFQIRARCLQAVPASSSETASLATSGQGP